MRTCSRHARAPALLIGRAVPLVGRAVLLAAASAILLAAPGVGGQALAGGGPRSQRPQPPRLRVPAAVQLSNERTFTSWAHPRGSAQIRSEPSGAARRVGSLHMLTEEGLPEVYLLRAEMTDASGAPWVLLRAPGRPNGVGGWVPREALGTIHVTDWALRVNLTLLRATLYRGGREVWSAPVGVGAPASPTPTGHFWVRELLRVPGDTLYGPFAFGTSDYSRLSEWPRGGVVGIHGTNQPLLVPGRPSHGCIRMRNGDIVYLARHLPVGAPLHIVG